MTRLSVVAGVAMLALAFPTPTATHTRASEPSTSRLPFAAPDDAQELKAVDRSTSARPDGGRRRSTRDPNLPRVAPRISSYPDGQAQRARLDEAIERFERAGLLLPDLEVHFSDPGDGCHDHLGVFDRNSNPWRIHVCSDLEFVLTHELAHAWSAANLDDAERASYLAHRGLSAWNDPDLHWRDRGTEDAAFMMQQVLMSKRLQPQSVWAERIEAFEQLTGRPPPPVATGQSSDTPTRSRRTVPDSAI